MRADYPLPRLWLLSDERNDKVLEHALRKLPRGSGFIFRHYHLSPRERLARYRALRRLAKARAHLVILSGSAAAARKWHADGWYGPPGSPGVGGPRLLALATVHDLREIARANCAGAHAALLSPVFPTRSHAGAAALGPLRFRLMALRAAMPVIALGGINARSARRLGWPRWAAIDGLSTASARPLS